MTRRLAMLLAVLLVASCRPPEEPANTRVPTTYRALAGLSMGAIGTAAIGFRHPDKFDAFASLGGPLDAALLLRTIDGFQTGGFCARSRLEAQLATINDPSTAGCVTHPAPLTFEHVQDFNHWQYTPTSPFDRTSYVGLFNDLTLAFGNLLTENPSSTFAPPGIPDGHARKPPADYCTNPIRVPGLKNKEWNADGQYDAITFCDGEPTTYFCASDESLVDFCSDPANITSPLPVAMEAAFAQTACASKGGAQIATRETHPAIMLRAGGRFDACRERTVPMSVALAFDFNGNGRRDFGEPLVNNSQERFDDLGTDGCANALEDGRGGCTATGNTVDLNGDDYDALQNPLGTEKNWKHDDGEPFADDGLDGVPGTSDPGESNGTFDMTSGRKRLYEHDARTNIAALPAKAIARLNLLLDGGIRDLFNFGLSAHQVFGRWKSLRPDDTQGFRDFAELPGLTDRNGKYTPWSAAWKRAPHNLEILYGKDNPTQADLLAGDGEHVGTLTQSFDRIATLYNFIGAQWPTLPRPVAPQGGSSQAMRERTEWFDSTALGAKRGYGLFLPPGYDAPENAETRYPVLFILHGYTGEPKQMLQSVFLADTYMKDTAVALRPMIIVAPSGACCFRHRTSNARDCREADDSGAVLAMSSEWERECVGGSFFIDQTGGGTAYEQSFFELMAVIDAKYRTLAPAEVDAR
ncbi:MAG: hypothetical protein JNM17_37525 [Archangium sp.]|nr:hypothetical protein [Archangium sp.]